MILPLRIFGGNPYLDYDLRFLDATDVPFVIIAVVCLFIAYYKVKIKKYDFNNEEIKIDSKKRLDFQLYDVLMQPKRNYESLATISEEIKPIPDKK